MTKSQKIKFEYPICLIIRQNREGFIYDPLKKSLDEPIRKIKNVKGFEDCNVFEVTSETNLINKTIISFYDSNEELEFYRNCHDRDFDISKICEFAVISKSSSETGFVQNFVVYDANKLLEKYTQEEIKNFLLNDKIYYIS